MPLHGGRGDAANLVHYVHAVDHLTEDGIAPLVLSAGVETDVKVPDAKEPTFYTVKKGDKVYALPAAGHHHHHVICRRCGRIDRLPGCDTGAVEAAARAKGYGDLTHVLEIYGVCPACASPSHD